MRFVMPKQIVVRCLPSFCICVYDDQQEEHAGVRAQVCLYAFVFMCLVCVCVTGQRSIWMMYVPRWNFVHTVLNFSWKRNNLLSMGSQAKIWLWVCVPILHGWSSCFDLQSPWRRRSTKACTERHMNGMHPLTCLLTYDTCATDWSMQRARSNCGYIRHQHMK